MENQHDLETFVEKLISEKAEFKDLEPEILEQVKADLLGRIEDRIKAAIVSNIPEDLLPEFEKIAESGTDEEVQSFCEKTIPNLPQIIASELVVFKQSYLA